MEKRLDEITSKLDSHDSRIASTEATIAPLLSRMDKLVTAISEQSKEQAVANANQGHQTETNKRMWARIERNESVMLSVQKEQDINRITMKIVNELPMKLTIISVMLLGLCGTVFYRLLFPA